MANDELVRAYYVNALLNKNNNLAQGGNILNPNQSDINGLATLDTSFSGTQPQAEPETKKANGFDQFMNNVLGFVDEIAAKFGAGFVGGWEGGLDLIATGLGALGWEDAKKWAEQDLGTAASEWAKTTLGLGAWYNRFAHNNWDAQEWEDIGQSFLDLNKAAFFAKNDLYDMRENLSDKYYKGRDDLTTPVGQFIGGAAHSIGFMLPSIMTAGGAASAGAGEIAQQAVSLGVMGAGAAGKGSEEAMNEGAEANKALGYGLASGAVEVASEIFVGKALGLVGLGTGKVAGVIGKGAKTTAKTGSKAFIKELGKTMFEEGMEEVVSAVMEPVTQSIYKGSDAFKDEKGRNVYTTGDFWFGSDGHFNESVLGQFTSGAFVGGLSGGVHEGAVYRKLGSNGYLAAKSFAELGEADAELAKAERTGKDTKKLEEERAKAASDFIEAVDKFMQKGTTSQKKAFAELMGDQSTLKKWLKEDKDLDNNINNYVSKYKTHEGAIAESFIKEANQKFGTDAELVIESGDVKTDSHGNKLTAWVDGNQIHINENYLKTSAGKKIAHEYMAHHLLKSLPSEIKSKLFNDVKKKTDFYKKYEDDLKLVYADELARDKKIFDEEVFANYMEHVFAGNNVATQLENLRQAFGSKGLLSAIQRMLRGAKKFKSPELVKLYVKEIKAMTKLMTKAKIYSRDDLEKLVKAADKLAEMQTQPAYSKEISDTDSKGNKLTEAQAEFFKDSKARDDNGKLVPVFHSTEAFGFTVFSENFNDKFFGKTQHGFYFSDSKDVAMSYAANKPQIYWGNLSEEENIFYGGIIGIFQKLGFRVSILDNDYGGVDFVDVAEDYLKNKSAFEEGRLLYAFGRLLNDHFIDFDFRVNGKSLKHETLRQSQTIDAHYGVRFYDDGNFTIDLTRDAGDIVTLDLWQDFYFPKYYKTKKTIKNQIYENILSWYNFGKNKTYSTYLNLKNPKIIDAKGSRWNNINFSSKRSLEAQQKIRKQYQEFLDEIWVREEIFKGITVPKPNPKYNKYSNVDLVNEMAKYIDCIKEVKSIYNGKEIAVKVKTQFGELTLFTENDHFKDVCFDIYNQILINLSEVGTTRAITAQVYNTGEYDGVIIKNVIDYGQYASSKEAKKPSNIYIAFNSNQIKNVDNINPTDNEDIRYSKDIVAGKYTVGSNKKELQVRKKLNGYDVYYPQDQTILTKAVIGGKWVKNDRGYEERVGGKEIEFKTPDDVKAYLNDIGATRVERQQSSAPRKKQGEVFEFENDEKAKEYLKKEGIKISPKSKLRFKYNSEKYKYLTSHENKKTIIQKIFVTPDYTEQAPTPAPKENIGKKKDFSLKKPIYINADGDVYEMKVKQTKGWTKTVDYTNTKTNKNFVKEMSSKEYKALEEKKNIKINKVVSNQPTFEIDYRGKRVIRTGIEKDIKNFIKNYSVLISNNRADVTTKKIEAGSYYGTEGGKSLTQLNVTQNKDGTYKVYETQDGENFTYHKYTYEELEKKLKNFKKTPTETKKDKETKTESKPVEEKPFNRSKKFQSRKRARVGKEYKLINDRAFKAKDLANDLVYKTNKESEELDYYGHKGNHGIYDKKSGVIVGYANTYEDAMKLAQDKSFVEKLNEARKKLEKYKIEEPAPQPQPEPEPQKPVENKPKKESKERLSAIDRLNKKTDKMSKKLEYTNFTLPTNKDASKKQTNSLKVLSINSIVSDINKTNSKQVQLDIDKLIDKAKKQIKKVAFKSVQSTRQIVEKSIAHLQKLLGDDYKVRVPVSMKDFTDRAFNEINGIKDITAEAKRFTDLLLETRVERTNGEYVGEIEDLLTEQQVDNLRTIAQQMIETAPNEKAHSIASRNYEIMLDKALANAVEAKVGKGRVRVLTRQIDRARKKVKRFAEITGNEIIRNGLNTLLDPFEEIHGAQNDGFSAKGYADRLSRALQWYTEENLSQNYEGLIYSDVIRDAIERIYDTLGYGVEKGRGVVYKNLTTETMQRSIEAIRLINDAIKQMEKNHIDKIRPSAEQTIKALSRSNYGSSKNILSRLLRMYKRGFAPSYAVLEEILGGNSEASRVLITELQNAVNQKTLYTGAYHDAINKKLKELGIKKTFDTKKVSVNGVEMTVDQAMGLYISTKVQANYDAIEEDGAVLYDTKYNRNVELAGKNQAETLKNAVNQALPEEYKKFADWLLDTMNGSVKKEYIKWFEQHFGKYAMRNEIGEINDNSYWSLKRSYQKVNNITKAVSNPNAVFSHAKHRSNLADNQVMITGALGTFTSYIDKLSRELYIKDIYQDALGILNVKTSNGKSVIDVISGGVDSAKDVAYLKDTLADILGANPREATLLDKMVSAFSVAKLSLNIGSMMKQFASIWTSNLPISKSAKGLFAKIFDGEAKTEYKSLVDEIGGLKYREAQKGVMRANADSVGQLTEKIARVGMIGISKVDLFTVSTGVYSLMVIGQDQYGYKIGTKENADFIKEHWYEFELSQIGNTALSRNYISRSESLTRYLFGFLQGANRAALGSQIHKWNLWLRNRKVDEQQLKYDLKDAIERLEDAKLEYELNPDDTDARNAYIEASAEVKDLENRLRDYQSYKIAGGKAIPTNMAAGILAQGIFIALINSLMKRIKGRKDWDELDVAEEALALVKAIGVDWVPFVNFVGNIVQGYEVDIPAINLLNQFSEIFKSGKSGQWQTLARQVAMLVGDMTGIPFQTLYQYIYGALKTFDPAIAYEMRSVLYGSSVQSATKTMKQYADRGNLDKTVSMVGLIMDKYKTGSTTDEINKEVASLYISGFNAMPKTAITQYTDDNGDVVKLNQEQIAQFNKLYGQATKDVSALISLTEYKNLTAEEKANAIKKIYDAYYSAAKARVSGSSTSNKLTNLILLTNGNVNLAKYILSLQKISQITETSKKTRKELVIEYINKLGGYTKTEKTLLMYLAGYSVSGTSQNILLNLFTSYGLTRKEALEMI